jgi:hypothetical protein
MTENTISVCARPPPSRLLYSHDCVQHVIVLPKHHCVGHLLMIGTHVEYRVSDLKITNSELFFKKVLFTGDDSTVVVNILVITDMPVSVTAYKRYK